MKPSSEIGETRITWTIAQVLYASLEARTQVLTSLGLRWVVSSEINGRWFFADIPICTKAGKCHGLEIAVCHRADDEAVPQRFGRWLRDCLAGCFSAAPAFTATSLILQPQLFLDNRIPDKYPEALAIASSRAATILAMSVELGETRASIMAARKELIAIYRAFLPDQYERKKGLLFHAQWLESLFPPAAEIAMETHESSSKRYEELCRIERLVLQPYDTLASHIRSELERHTSKKSDCGAWTYANLHNTLVARFAHIQLIRLWGPEYPGALHREAQIVRCLASGTELG
jgi:hypothetical protein